MVLELKLRKVGNSVGLILPKEVLGWLQVELGDSVSLTKAPDRTLHLSPHKAEVARQMEVAQNVMKRYRDTLRELAK
jgi:putative addiction module antidote